MKKAQQISYIESVFEGLEKRKKKDPPIMAGIWLLFLTLFTKQNKKITNLCLELTIWSLLSGQIEG